LAKLTARERELAKQIGRAVGRPEGDDPWVDPAVVRKALPADAVLVEIVRFDNLVVQARGRPRRDPPHYAAWVIPAAGGGDVRLIDLGPASAVEEAVAQVRQALQSAAVTIGRRGEADAEQDLRQPLAALADRVLRPLLEQIGRRKRWVLSPDADLWLVPWAALPLPDGRYAVEGHQIRFVGSGRNLTRRDGAEPADPPLLLADPDFDLDPDRAAAAMQRVLPTRPATRNNPVTRSDLGTGRWGRLEGTAAEARAIQPLVKQYARQEPRLYVQDQALEGVFKAAVRPSLVVLSTHGFFLGDHEVSSVRLPASWISRGLDWARPHVPQSVTRPTTRARPLENPLVRCGLVLAGANQRHRATDPGQDDGVLTGLEIVGTDLRGCELVVLSACETGLGEVHTGEGVAGLRQAFQLAGAKAVVATLWKIPDQVTADLMTRFFGRLLGDHDPAEALRQAQLEVIRDRRARHRAAHPFYWAAFTLTGPPGPTRAE
jgi:CHAT domain-containing protein